MKSMRACVREMCLCVLVTSRCVCVCLLFVSLCITRAYVCEYVCVCVSERLCAKRDEDNMRVSILCNRHLRERKKQQENTSRKPSLLCSHPSNFFGQEKRKCV